MNTDRGWALAAGRMKNILPAAVPTFVRSGTMKNTLPRYDWPRFGPI
ncbi:hypothetical protein [Paenibacillus sp. GP183]|nr:hypothetical protein [Paenibacillus sp. GP183]